MAIIQEALSEAQSYHLPSCFPLGITSSPALGLAHRDSGTASQSPFAGKTCFSS